MSEEAAAAGLIEPVLVGPLDRISETAALHHFNTAGFPTVEAPDDREAAARAVEMVRKGEAEMLIKGALHTDNVRTRLASCALGLLLAHARRTGLPGGADRAFPDAREEQ